MSSICDPASNLFAGDIDERTSHFALPALTITELYRCRGQVELLFKWIKRHLRIKVFFATSENAVKTQIWIDRKSTRLNSSH